MNIRGVYLHIAADAAVSVGVAMAGMVMLFTGWYWLDPAISLVIVAAIVVGTWGLLRESVHLELDAVPPHIDVAAVGSFLRSLPGVADLHDLHIWGMSTTESALTVHLVMPDGYPGDIAMDGITRTLAERFSIHHSTCRSKQKSLDTSATALLCKCDCRACCTSQHAKAIQSPSPHSRPRRRRRSQ